MLQSEFEQLSGCRVTPAEYARIEKIYLADETISKQDFCAAYAKNGELTVFENILLNRLEQLEEYEKLINDLKKSADARVNAVKQDVAIWALSLASSRNCSAVAADQLNEQAIALIGKSAYLREKIDRRYQLTERDRDMLTTILTNAK
jgi:hypothetical protein